MTWALAALALSLALLSDAAACASCIGSPYGDRTYNLAYLGLILMPFAVVLTVGAVITRSWWTRRHAADPTDPTVKETT
jgi:hypothetical protein